jgi:Fic family protein
MSFNPTYPNSLEPLPPKLHLSNADFGDLLLKARVELAELKGSCGQIPNPMLLTAPAAMRESVASSNIENIHTTLAKALQWQLFPEAEQHLPEKEVLHYREAMFWGIDQLRKTPISNRVILGVQAHLIPLGSGRYRREQNQIVNLQTREPIYTPPPAQDIPLLISNWEKFVNQENPNLDPLVLVIIAHYQFEAIHPFRDGNGRTGRILMVLQLIQSGLLSLPVLFISGYINHNRHEYYEKLLEVTSKEKWQSYIEFMLTGFYKQARETRETLERINDLYHLQKAKVKSVRNKIYSAELLEAMFTYPVLTPTKLAAELNMHYTTTSRYLSEMVAIGLLKETIVGKYHLFINYSLLDILQKE